MIRSHSAAAYGARRAGAFLAAVEQAKGVLMESFGVSAGQAGKLVDAWARECGRSPEVVAEVLVHQIWEGDDACCDHLVARALERALRDLPRFVAVTTKETPNLREEHRMTEKPEEPYPSPEGPEDFVDPGIDDAENEEDPVVIGRDWSDQDGSDLPGIAAAPLSLTP
jgi:hypothetical protein